MTDQDQYETEFENTISEDAERAEAEYVEPLKTKVVKALRRFLNGKMVWYYAGLFDALMILWLYKKFIA